MEPGKFRDINTVNALQILWNMLSHPPPPTNPSPPEYRYRQADGSHNVRLPSLAGLLAVIIWAELVRQNPDLPDAGKAGTVYGTTVTPQVTPLSLPSTKPDPGAIFDCELHSTDICLLLCYFI